MPIDWEFIKYEEEGDKKPACKGYIPRNGKTGRIAGKSGVTIAVGFDIGQRNEYDLKRYSFPLELYNKLQPYLGRTKEEAADYLKSHPLIISQDEAQLIYDRTREVDGKAMKKKYEKITSKKFNDLPSNYQTVLLSNGYQFGAGSERFKKLSLSMSKNAEGKSEIIDILQSDKTYNKRRSNEISLINNPDFKNYKNNPSNTEENFPLGSSIKPGQTGKEISNLQNQLKGKGFFPDQNNGIYDKKTEEAVKNFQKANGLKADGICGPQTKQALLSSVKPLSPAGVDLSSPQAINFFENEKINGVCIDLVRGDIVFLKENNQIQLQGISCVDLAIALKIYYDNRIRSKRVSFSLDPDDPYNVQGPYQKKVFWPDLDISKRVLKGTKFGEIIFECDFLMKQMSMGIKSDLSPFNYPSILSAKGLKPQHKMLGNRFESKKEELSRLWITCKNTFGKELQTKKQILVKVLKVEIKIEAREMEMKNGLSDKAVQDPSKACYIFAEKFTELYEDIAKIYPCFAKLKEMYKALYVAKWMWEHQVVINEELITKIYEDNLLNLDTYQEKISTLACSEENIVTLPPKYETIYEGGYEKIKTITRKSIHTQHIWGGVDMTTKKIQNHSEIHSKEEIKLNENEKTNFIFSPVCSICRSTLSFQETQYRFNGQFLCSVHHPLSCYFCMKLIINEYPSSDSKNYKFHENCFKKMKKYEQNKEIEIEFEKCKQKYDIKEESLSYVRLEENHHWICQICKHSQNHDRVCCDNCENYDVDLFIKAISEFEQSKKMREEFQKTKTYLLEKYFSSWEKILTLNKNEWVCPNCDQQQYHQFVCCSECNFIKESLCKKIVSKSQNSWECKYCSTYQDHCFVSCQNCFEINHTLLKKLLN